MSEVPLYRTPVKSIPRKGTAPDASYAPLDSGGDGYRGVSLIRNTPLLGPYSKTVPRVLWWH